MMTVFLSPFRFLPPVIFAYETEKRRQTILAPGGRRKLKKTINEKTGPNNDGKKYSTPPLKVVRAQTEKRVGPNYPLSRPPQKVLWRRER